METILLVGDSFKYLRTYITSHGMEYVQLRDRNKCKHPDKKLKRRVVCDFSTSQTIQSALQELNSRYSVHSVLCTYENYVLSAAIIAEQLNLPGMPLEAAKACTDKHLMRQLFAQAPKKISPDFAEVTCEEDVIRFTDSHSFPLMMKPANLAKSLLVTKNNTMDELLENYRKTTQQISQIYAKYAPSRKPKILIEEFMPGPVHSVDAFVDSEGTPHVLENVVDYQTGYDIGYDDNFHYSRILPSKLSDEERAEVRSVAALGCRALGMRNSPAHVEIIRTTQGPMIVEIGARNGGYRERMHMLANGIDITGNALALALNEPLQLTAKKNDPCAVLELFPKTAGKFIGIKNEAKLLSLSSLNYYAIKQPVGAHVGKSSDGFKMCAVIILHNADPVQFQNDLNFVDKNVEIITKI